MILGIPGKRNSTGEIRRPRWLPYLRVTDIDQTIARVETAGDTVLLAPAEQYDEGSVAIVSDPTGGVFAIQAPRTTE